MNQAIKPPPHKPDNTGRRTGTRVVAALVLAGVGFGALTVWYWTAQGRWMRQRDSEQAPVQGAGSAVWDKNAADRQLDELKRAFEHIVTHKQPAGAFVDTVERLVERYPRYAPVRTLSGQVWLYAGRPQRAYEQLALSLELNGQQPEVHLLSGTIAYRLDRVDQAIGHYSKAVGLDPSSPRYRMHLAQAFISQNKQQEARDVLLEALRIDSSLPEAYAALSGIYAQQNKLALALAQIGKALDHTPASDRVQRVHYTRRKAALLRRDNRPSEALLTLQGLTQDRNEGVLDDMATCWSMMGKPEKAAELFEQAMAADPTQPAWVVRATRWQIRAGDHTAARQHLGRLRQLSPRADEVAQLEGLLE